ncbi:uncharacterized protein TNCV_4394361 [Trichonephila clavipes]|uniref:Uncharacterized protein n=1 Tax=Trichonephila clavipes TaxID=2585209 RepID=A0A8X6W4F5_TRICX|nr:uncharacterized protein TNCV_4394361 [Trichonephila clavipes]
MALGGSLPQINLGVQDGNTERRAGSQRPPITNSREDRNVTRMTLMDREAASRALSQESGHLSCLQHQDNRIGVWRHRGERTLAECILHRHTGSSPGMMIWDAIGYTSR